MGEIADSAGMTTHGTGAEYPSGLKVATRGPGFSDVRSEEMPAISLPYNLLMCNVFCAAAGFFSGCWLKCWSAGGSGRNGKCSRVFQTAGLFVIFMIALTFFRPRCSSGFYRRNRRAGTQSVKVVVYDQAHRVVAAASAPLELISGGDGDSHEQAGRVVKAVRT